MCSPPGREQLNAASGFLADWEQKANSIPLWLGCAKLTPEAGSPGPALHLSLWGLSCPITDRRELGGLVAKIQCWRQAVECREPLQVKVKGSAQFRATSAPLFYNHPTSSWLSPLMGAQALLVLWSLLPLASYPWLCPIRQLLATCVGI